SDTDFEILASGIFDSSENEAKSIDQMRTIMTAVTATLILAVSIWAAAGGTGVTKASFDALKTDMSYAQVVEIIGRDGELISESEMGNLVTKMYSWKAEKKDHGALGANMNVMFQNDKLVSKSQYGLK